MWVNEILISNTFILRLTELSFNRTYLWFKISKLCALARDVEFLKSCWYGNYIRSNIRIRIFACSIYPVLIESCNYSWLNVKSYANRRSTATFFRFKEMLMRESWYLFTFWKLHVSHDRCHIVYMASRDVDYQLVALHFSWALIQLHICIQCDKER